MEKVLESFHLVQGGDGGGTRLQIPRKFLIWCTPKDAFIGSHSDIRVETGIPVYQMEPFQENFEWGRKGFRHGVWVGNV